MFLFKQYTRPQDRSWQWTYHVSNCPGIAKHNQLRRTWRVWLSVTWLQDRSNWVRIEDRQIHRSTVMLHRPIITRYTSSIHMAVAPIGGLGGRRPPKNPPKFFFIGFIESMFNICTCISSFSTFQYMNRLLLGVLMRGFWQLLAWRDWRRKKNSPTPEKILPPQEICELAPLPHGYQSHRGHINLWFAM